MRWRGLRRADRRGGLGEPERLDESWPQRRSRCAREFQGGERMEERTRGLCGGGVRVDGGG
jgi:hypothetical protein